LRRRFVDGLMSSGTFSVPDEVKLGELPAALSYALDMTEGQPPEHCVRCCSIGMKIGREIGLSENRLRDLYYTLLLKISDVTVVPPESANFTSPTTSRSSKISSGSAAACRTSCGLS
jgi:hypothetical protein